MRVRITKVGIMPNGEESYFAAIGDSFTGEANGLPKIGERYNVYGNTRLEISTSFVTEELNAENIFKTTYSIYRLEEL